jgi:Rrf2 family protein
MHLSKAGEYAVRAMLHLAAKQGKNLTQISNVSAKWNIPESFLRKILNNLSKAGLVNSTRGKRGGFELARSAAEITLLDIIEVSEGELFFNHCLVGPEECEHRTWCPVHPVWREAQDAFSEVLRRKTLADLVANSEFQKFLDR